MMARRHSLQNQPVSLGSPPSVHEFVFDLGGGAKQGAGHSKRHKRSTSFTGFFTRLLPSHRPERGSTIRDRGFWEQQQSGHAEQEQKQRPGHEHGSDSIVSSGWNPAIPLPRSAQSTPDRGPKRQGPLSVQSQPLGHRPRILTPHRQATVGRDRQHGKQRLNVEEETRIEAGTATQTAPSESAPGPGAPTESTIRRAVTSFDAKREARRLRRSLKESRDFLGVQGINPHTGVMDILTPTSSSPTDHTMMSAPEPRAHSESMSDFRAAYQREARTRDAEEASLERLRKEQEALSKTRRKKDSIRSFQQRVRWRKDKNQWSSVAEPDLSPIADASTRSHTPRSASDGAILYPSSIQNALGVKPQQDVSTPADLPMPASPSRSASPSSRSASPSRSAPGIVTQNSSDTVIHTPHPGSRRKYSLIADVLGEAIKGPSSKADRRASEPGPGVGAESQSSSPSDRAIARKPIPIPKGQQKPPQLKIVIPDSSIQDTIPGLSSNPNSFLGARIESRGPRYHHGREQVIVSPSTPVQIEKQGEVGQDENRRLDGLQNMDKMMSDLPPKVTSENYGGERKAKVRFIDHRSSLESPSSQNSSIKQSQSSNATTVASTPPQEGTLPMRRLSSSRKDTSLPTMVLSENKPDNLNNLTAISSGPKTPDSLTSRWAKQLMEDIASLGLDVMDSPPPAEQTTISSPPTVAAQIKSKALQTRHKSRTEAVMMNRELPKSASTPTTTITGYDPRLLVHARSLHRRHRSDGHGSNSGSTDDRVIRISAGGTATKRWLKNLESARDTGRPGDSRATRASTAALTDAEAETGQWPQTTTGSTSVRQPSCPSFDLLASPSRLPPSVWPSLHIPALHQRQKSVPERTEEQQETDAIREETTMFLHREGPGPASVTTSSHQPRPVTCLRGGHLLDPTTTTTSPQDAEELEPITRTISASQLTATRERCEKLCRRVSRRHRKEANREAVMTPAVGPAAVRATAPTPPDAPATGNTSTAPSQPRPATTASPTCTSTYQTTTPSPEQRYSTPNPSIMISSSSSSSSYASIPSPRQPTPTTKPQLHPHQPSLRHPRSPATEAARTALAGTPTPTRVDGAAVQVPARSRARLARVISHRRPAADRIATPPSAPTATATACGLPLPDRSPRGFRREMPKEDQDQVGSGGGRGGGPSSGGWGRGEVEEEEEELVGGGGGGGGGSGAAARRAVPAAGRSRCAGASGADAGVRLSPRGRRDPPVAPSSSSSSAAVAETAVAGLRAYWRVVAPAFDAASPVSARFAAGRPTWRDGAVYLLALGFVLGAVLAVVWGVKGALLAAALVRAVARGCAVLVGF